MSTDRNGHEAKTATDKTSALIAELHRVVSELEALYPGKKFTPDGHLVGSIGEVIAAARFDIALHPNANKGCDGVTPSGRQVEIKATYGSSGVGVRVTSNGIAHDLLVLRLLPDGEAEVVYNGPYATAHRLIAGKKATSNGQHRMSLHRLRQLNKEVPDADRVPARIA